MDKYYWHWLNSIPGIGAVKIKKLLEVFPSPEQLYKTDLSQIRKTGIIGCVDLQNIGNSKQDGKIRDSYARMKQQGISMVTMDDREYPGRLRNIYDLPPCLYYKGSLPADDRPAVAIVGSRLCSEYGRTMAQRLGRELSGMGIDVISGMAAGIDAAGHMGAISANKATFAVMGCGVDICYPSVNRKIYDRIAQTGGILSEFPPGMPPKPGHFPMRNRIISGLSDIVVVVEAGRKSGSLITADQALDQNREVMAVPGRVGDKTSEGCNSLIKSGAGIVTAPEDVLEALKMPYAFCKGQDSKNKFCLAPEEEMVYSGLDLIPKSLDDIMIEMNMSSADVIRILMRLVLKGAVKETAGNYYSKL